MIRFFRKVRKKVLSESKYKQYFIYAIGEILLVAIGILIAVQVNNWNTSQKRNVLEKQMLREVKVGLEADLSDININLKGHLKILNSQNIIIEWLDSNREYSDSLSYHFPNVSSGTVFLSNYGPYKTLNQIGIRLISNDRLRDQITKVYDIVYEGYSMHNKIYKEFQISFHKNINESHFESTNRSGMMKPLDIIKIKSDNEYSYQIKTIRDWNMFLIESNIRMAKREVIKTIEMISNELQIEE